MGDYLDLLTKRRDKYSALGNDGVVEFIFKTIGVKNGLFVEFGAWDGVYTSNCRKLFREGWDGIFIEMDKKKFKDLKKNYKAWPDRITCLNRMVATQEENSFDSIVAPHLKGREIDFCSIDIDGLDVEVFETFEKCLPKVICIESGFMLPPFHERVPPSVSVKTVQQSLKTTVEVFEKKGYKLVGAGYNCFFVKEKYYHLFNVSDDLLHLYLNGLKVFSRYIPSIWRKLKKVDGFKKYRNDIVLKILKETKYDFAKDFEPGYRKRWKRQNKAKIYEIIDSIEKRGEGKYE